MAMARIIRKEGSAVPKAVAMAPCVFLRLVANEDTDIDSEHTRTTLGDGYQVEHLVLAHPLVAVDDFLFYQWNHGISTPEGEHANLKERAERLPIEITHNTLHFSLFTFASTHFLAFTKASIHGVTSSMRRSHGYQAHCHGKMARSKWGIMAR